MFGLLVNVVKNGVYFRGCSSVLKEQIVTCLGFAEDYLPIRYLGVPLISSKLSRDDCSVLIDRIATKVNYLTSKFLSYLGRIQLINSVLWSMIVYWGSIFILSKAVVSEVERICRTFLWKNTSDKRYGGLVAWKEVCTSKKLGGLGVKNIACWNKAVAVKHIWDLLYNKSSL